MKFLRAIVVAAVFLSLSMACGVASSSAHRVAVQGRCGQSDNPRPQGKQGQLRVDIDGDGHADTVRLNPVAKPCPLLAVDYYHGPRVSLELRQFGIDEFPEPELPPRILRVIDLGVGAGRAIIVQTFTGGTGEAVAVILASRKGLMRLRIPARFGPGNSFELSSSASGGSSVGCTQNGDIAFVVSGDFTTGLNNHAAVTTMRVRAGRAVVVARSVVGLESEGWRRIIRGSPFASCRRP